MERLWLTLAVLAVCVLAGYGLLVGWRHRAQRQEGLPELPSVPADLGPELATALTGLYVSTTTAGNWQDRIVARGLGRRANGTTELTADGVLIDRIDDDPIFLPAGSLIEVGTAPGIAGKLRPGRRGSGPALLGADPPPADRAAPVGPSGPSWEVRPPGRANRKGETAMAAETAIAGPFDDQLATRLMHQRIVVLGQEVDDPIANRICAELLLLSAEDQRRDISLYINSPGGSVSAGLAIYDTMRLIPNDVSTLAMGIAASMGQFLLSAGTRGKRFALPHARILMHQGSAGIQGTAVDVQIQAENLEHTKSVMNRLIAEHTGHDLATIARDADRDRWFTAEEARDYGFVDRVLESVEDIRPAADRHRIGLA